MIHRRPNSSIRYFEYRNYEKQGIPPGLMNGIVSTAFDAFGPGMTREEILEHINPADRVYIAYETGTGTVLGFSSAYLESMYICFAIAPVRHCAQGKGVYNHFCNSRINFALETGRKAFHFHTQNPKILAGVERSLEELLKAGIISGFNVTTKNLQGII